MQYSDNTAYFITTTKTIFIQQIAYQQFPYSSLLQDTAWYLHGTQMYIAVSKYHSHTTASCPKKIHTFL